ncbi:MAG: hypothetical protein A2X86_16315 [Bdellovibrionales bacterium GWA2_49_15]|nr:MAG: hypothetical protein A2X86_16315 [Bdellovibrionales bacterium GWA2_49_15]HAZ13671.1 hypothetical protein [Bdellovibrionales bacterium]
MKALLLSLITTLILGQANALETDQYLAWGKDLIDSSADLNAYYNQNFERAVARINAAPHLVNKSCEDVTIDVLQEYHAFWWGERIENWILDNANIQKIPEYNGISRMDAIAQSIYRDVFKFRAKILGNNIRIGEVNLGIDKMGHFSSVGLSYYERMLAASKEMHVTPAKILEYLNKLGEAPIEFPIHDPRLNAVNKAISWGIKMEKWMWGHAVSDTFSYADLEANYQGLLLALNFCGGTNPYMKKEGGIFVVNKNRLIDLREYISPLFDETYNPSHYQKKIYRTIKPYLRDYCDLRESDEVKSLFANYDKLMIKSGHSYSRQYLEFLRTTKKSPSSKKYYLHDPARARQTMNFVCIEQ